MEEVLAEIESTNSVGVHIRRYDKADLKLYGRVRTDQRTLDYSYYEKALALVRKRERNLRVFLFSDDPEAKLPLSYRGEFTRIEPQEIGNCAAEQALMARCKHQVIANSTFSWWAAWLNLNPDKLVVAPRRWFRSNRRNDGIFPSGWEVLG